MTSPNDDLKARLCRGEWRALLDPELPLLLMTDAGTWWSGTPTGAMLVWGAWQVCLANLIRDRPGQRRWRGGVIGDARTRAQFLACTQVARNLLRGQSAPDHRAALAVLRTYLPVSP
jgi:hypothetical protein